MGAPTVCAPRGRKPADVSEGKGEKGFLLSAFALLGLFSLSLLKAGVGEEDPLSRNTVSKISRQKGAGPLPLTERKRGADPASRRKWSRARYHLILDNQKKDS